MAISNDLNQEINDLIEQLYEHETLYQTAAQNAKSDALRKLFQERAAQRSEFAHELAQADAVDAEPSSEDKDDGVLASIERGFMTFKAALTIEYDKTDEVILKESHEADDELLESYNSLLTRDDVPMPLHTLLEGQYEQILAAVAYNVSFSDQQPVVLALFEEMRQAETAVDSLLAAGVPDKEITLVSQIEDASEMMPTDKWQTTRESAGAGALGGTAFGGVLGVAAGLSVTIFTGALPATAGVTALGMGIGGLYGGLFGALLGWGIAEDESHRYVEGVRQGMTLLAVYATEETLPDILTILDEHNAQDVRRWREPLDDVSA